MYEEEKNAQVTVYRWVLGILVALVLAGGGFVMNAITMSTATKIDFVWQRIGGMESAIAENTRLIRSLSERIGILEWQQKQLGERRDKKPVGDP